MQVQKIQHNNTQFKGIITMQNLRKGGKVTTRETSKYLDRQLFDMAFNNICGGRYRCDEWKEVSASAIKDYADKLRYSHGINLPQSAYWRQMTKLNYDDGIYGIEVPGKYRIWHTL